MKLRMAATWLALMIATSGCLSIKAYVDPQLPRVGYADLLARGSEAGLVAGGLPPQR